MIAELGVGDGDGAFGGFFVYADRSDWFVGAVAGNNVGVIATEIIVVVRARSIGAGFAPRQRVGNCVFLNESGVFATAIACRPCIIIFADGPWIDGSRNADVFFIEANVIDTHPVTAAIAVIADALQQHDIVVFRADAGAHFGEGELA